ncbi:MAG: hypothetical protein IJV54_07885 [Bacteroidales bacterium]|nr:hypothetical protein [Bacteroidales bacterium]
MKRILSTIIISLAFICASAQDFSTGYFLEGYTYSYRMNPALRPSRNFIALPAISNVNVNLQGNVGIDSFYFPLSNGKVGTFRHPEVSSSEFLKGLHDKNQASLNVNTNVLAFGFKTDRMFHTVDFNIRSINGISASKNLFKYMKDGADGTLSIPEVTFDNQTFVEVAYGLNTPIGDNLVFGGRIKLLAGAEMLHAEVSDISISSSGYNETISAKGVLKGAYNGLIVKTTDSADGLSHDVVEWEKVDFEPLEDFDGPSGYGAAIDLGIEYRLTPEVKLSASITDIGGIAWDAPLNAETSGNSWEHEISGEYEFEDMIDMFEFHQKGSGKESRVLPATVRLAAEYNLSEKIGFGALATKKFGAFPLTELRGSVNTFVGNFFGFSASAAYSNYGFSFGGAMNFDAHALDFFIGFDSIPTRFSTQWIPLGHANIAATFGLVITFGKQVAIK